MLHFLPIRDGFAATWKRVFDVQVYCASRQLAWRALGCALTARVARGLRHALRLRRDAVVVVGALTVVRLVLTVLLRSGSRCGLRRRVRDRHGLRLGLRSGRGELASKLEGRVRPKLARFRARLARIRRIWRPARPTFGPNRPKLARTKGISARIVLMCCDCAGFVQASTGWVKLSRCSALCWVAEREASFGPDRDHGL